MACKHTNWLDIATSSHNQHTFRNFNRLRALINADVFSDLTTQTPSMMTFIGGPSKNRLLRGITSKASLTASKSSHVLCNLHIARSTAKTQNPVLIADCLRPGTRQDCHRTNSTCHKATSNLLSSMAGPVITSSSLFSRILCPFSDILRISTADYGGFNRIIDFLEIWILTGFRSSTLSHPPQLVIITEGIAGRPQWDPEATQTLCQLIGKSFDEARLSSFFLSVEVLSVPTGYQNLMRFLQPRLEMMQAARKKNHCLFKLIHFHALFDAACLNWVQNPDAPFDFINATRLTHPVPLDFLEHFDRVFSLLEGSALPLIASSMVLDSSPPAMHHKKPPPRCARYLLRNV